MGPARFKVSVVIPYKQRLRNLRIVFTSLVEQTLPSSQFEVVVGAMEYSQAYFDLCQEFGNRLNIVSVLSNGEWNRSAARNIGIRQAVGQVVVLVDADVALPTRCLESFYDQYFADGQNICVMGQLIGLNGRVNVPHQSEDFPEHRNFREILADYEARSDLCVDKRWIWDAFALPWAFAWTALIALPTEVARRSDRLFDENFVGWGGEDIEWAYRLVNGGTPLVRGEGVFGLHLPHARDVSANFTTYNANKPYFVSKFPTLEVEMFCAYECWDANRWYDDIRQELSVLAPGNGETLGAVRGTVDGTDTLVLGAVVDGRNCVPDAQLRALFDDGAPSQVFPLIGLSLPFLDGSVEECRVLPPILRLDKRYRDTVLQEAKRVAFTTVLPEPDHVLG